MKDPGTGRFVRGQKRSVAERFWEKVDRSGGPDACWPWTAYRQPTGYGLFNVDGKATTSQRVAFFLANGRWPKPEGLHRCDFPPCCNPGHIFEGTQAANMADMVAKGRQRSILKLVCKRGHAMAGSNVVVLRRGGRRCRACAVIRKRGYRQASRTTEPANA